MNTKKLNNNKFRILASMDAKGDNGQDTKILMIWFFKVDKS